MLAVLIVWTILIVAIFGFALYRRIIALHEETTIGFGPVGEKLMTEQAAIARRLDWIDLWGKRLTIIAAASAALILIVFAILAGAQGEPLN